MYLIENSQDLLNIVKAVSIFGLAVFICWAIFYFTMILRQMFKVVKEMRERFIKIDEVITALKEKIEHSASYLALIGEGVKKLVEVIKEYAGDGKKKKKSGKRK
ncbi:MAG: hypothetical protein Q8N21_03590 [bacterium]|nr:hypothetical protein [bacterium]